MRKQIAAVTMKTYHPNGKVQMEIGGDMGQKTYYEDGKLAAEGKM